MAEEMEQGEKVHEFAEDTSKSKGTWVKCVNSAASDELRAHTGFFKPDRNPDYHAMVPRARDQIVGWIDMGWYESSQGKEPGVEDLEKDVEGRMEDLGQDVEEGAEEMERA